jgi:hypothetical protein
MRRTMSHTRTPAAAVALQLMAVTIRTQLIALKFELLFVMTTECGNFVTSDRLKSSCKSAAHYDYKGQERLEKLRAAVHGGHHQTRLTGKQFCAPPGLDDERHGALPGEIRLIFALLRPNDNVPFCPE